MAKRKPIPAEKILRVFRRDKFTCQYCGATGTDLEVDHVIPVALGGSNSEVNLITACKKCNRKKGKKLNFIPNISTPNLKKENAKTKKTASESVSPLCLSYTGINGDKLELPDTPENRELFQLLVTQMISNSNITV